MRSEKLSFYKTIKKEISLQLSRIYPITILKGNNRGCKLFGDVFYNRRSEKLHKEEDLYALLNYEGKVIVDVGAHIGIHTIYFAKNAHKGKVIAIEPNPLNFFFLSKNITLNRLENVIAVNAGLSNEESELVFVSSRYNRAKGTFKSDKQKFINKRERLALKKKIPVLKFDQIVEKYNLGSIDFIKIDTEGFEPFVVQGMPETLKAFTPILYFEIHGLDTKQKIDDLESILSFLKRFNYKIIKLEKGLLEVTLNNIEDYNCDSYIAHHATKSLPNPILEFWK